MIWLFNGALAPGDGPTLEVGTAQPKDSDARLEQRIRQTKPCCPLF